MRHPLFSIIFILSLAFPALLQAASPAQQADSAYKQKDYSAAASLYGQALNGSKENTLSEEQKSTLYYNLGNCHYRLKDYAHAVLAYQRALRLDPANDDAAFNLELTQTKLADHFDAPSEMFFVSWTKSLMRSQSSTTWGLWGLAAFLLGLACFSAYYFLHLLWARKLSFVFTCVFAVAFLLCQIFAWRQHSRFQNLKQAVVMQTIETFDTPTSSANKKKTLHEGTLLTITDSYKTEWLQVELPDESQAWIKKQGIELVTP